ncbi:hypothetical protein ASD11_01195 [Aeromicrobium sp. Root495]|nr:hypothetical protein ASD11_01195 [Aeromicrobium sp. Root495]
MQGEVARGLAPVDAEADKAGRRAGKRFGGGMRMGVGKIAGALGAAFAAVKVKDFLGDAIGEARESQKVGALTTQTIKATGGAANVTASQVGNLAAAISNKSGMDDEAIQTGANLLLTFKNVRNEAGKGNKIFNQATQAATDLSAAGFGSVSSASVLMGKALNDPIKGISALGRSGVTFTEDQKKLIKGLVEQGNTLAAQKIILKEVRGQVGGAAEASATAGEKLAVTWGNFKETIGTALLPLIDKLATFVGGRLLPALLDLGPSIARGVAVIRGFLSGLGGDTDRAGSRVAQFRTTVAQVWSDVKSIFTDGVSIVRSLWRAFGDNILQYAKASLTNLLTILRGTFSIIRGIFKVFSSLLRGDWRGVWDGIKLILRGAWAVIRGVVAQGWNAIRFAFKSAAVVVKAIFREMWSGIGNLARSGVNGVVSAVRGLPGKIRALGGLLRSAGRAVLSALLDGLKGGSGFVSEVAGNIWQVVKGSINAAISKINGALPNSIGKGKISVDLPDNPIPQLAKGGIVKARPGGTLALLAEAGQDEMVVPMGSASTDGSNISPLPAGGSQGDVVELLLRLIEAVEAGHRLVLGGREFTLAVAEANHQIKRKGGAS